jgi:type IV pilus assembly protein PilE
VALEQAAMSEPRGTGYTLLELLVVLTIIGLLATSALSSYRGYVQRVNRMDASSALLRVAGAQERHRLAYQHYAWSLAAAPPEGLGLPTRSERGLYRLALAAGPEGLDFRVSAEVEPAGAQRDDLACWRLELDHRGERLAGARGQGTGRAAAARCWGF